MRHTSPFVLPLTGVLLLASCATDSEWRAESSADSSGLVRTLPDPAQPDVTRARRERVAAELGDGLLVVSAGEEPEGRFLAEDDFYWLTGVGSPDAVYLLQAREGRVVVSRLYLHPYDERHELWNGPRLSPGEEAARLSGVTDTRELERLTEDLAALAPATVATNGDHTAVYAAGTVVEELLAEHGVEFERPGRVLRGLQAPKDAGEIAATRAAIDITQEALVDGMRLAVPGAWEFTVEAAIESGFRRRGAEGLAFPSICGAGPNTCFLHYRSNERRLEAGDLLLMDVGAKFRHYCADVTRTIPVSGRFTERQREVYTLVYDASRAAAEVLRPGASLGDAHQVAVDYLERHGYRNYFPHSVGHGLGLRVHDAPSRGTTLEPGMVVTIEPGIYIAEEELGVRIEDDYLITADGAELLSGDLPSHPDELEAFLARIRR